MKKTDDVNKESQFPISKTKTITGTRRLIREKSLQILVAHFVSNVEISLLFEHIFNRNFDIDDEETNSFTDSNILENDIPLISDEEIINMFADVTIIWRPEDVVLGKTLIYCAAKNYDSFMKYIKKVSDNWEPERISIIDKTIIMICLAEFISCPDIPVKVSLNEAIEIAKLYSSDKSSLYVNGILENIKKIFLEKNLITKTGKGLQ